DPRQPAHRLLDPSPHPDPRPCDHRPRRTHRPSGRDVRRRHRPRRGPRHRPGPRHHPRRRPLQDAAPPSVRCRRGRAARRPHLRRSRGGNPRHRGPMTMRDATIAEAVPDPGLNPALAGGPTVVGGQSAGGRQAVAAGAADTTASGLALETQLQLLTPISLDEINAQARLMTRVDRKYFLPRGLFIDLLAATRDDLRVLEIDGKHRFEYRTAYFDTPDFRFYRDHVQERRHRFKVRTRTYVDTGTCHLEVKSKGYRGQTVKERIAHPLDSPLTLTDGDREFIDSVLGGPPARTGGRGYGGRASGGRASSGVASGDRASGGRDYEGRGS